MGNLLTKYSTANDPVHLPSNDSAKSDVSVASDAEKTEAVITAPVPVNLKSSKDVMLKKFDMRHIGVNKVCLFIGKRGSGKSWGIRDVLYQNRKDIGCITVVSCTEKAHKFYGNHVPEIFIHADYDTDITRNIITRQKAVHGKPNNGIAYVLDDVMDTDWINDREMAEIFYNGRIYNILFIASMQYPLGIPPKYRANTDYVFIFADNNIANRKRIYEHYGGIFPTFELFDQLMDSCTSDFGCMVIDNTSKSRNIEDVIFWYRGSGEESNTGNHVPEFHIGSEKIWEFNDRFLRSSKSCDCAQGQCQCTQMNHVGE